ncbi:MAG: hypothetical protein CVU48_00845 [Candidatus Cloacimonetes bacterium HGW-Cloacimonetes-1]|jgi:outer membrane protein|nr:MAG: hypothetical protein CVU48_00845 [Candidatus Cloacimonetes bacterium HGW-Cloacimonetes-1]
MKKLALLIVIIAMIGLCAAQTVKLGIVNTDKVILDSNEAAEISRLFTLDKQNWTNQVRQMDEEIKQMERQFEIDKLTKNETAKREAQARIDQKKTEAGRLLEEYFGDGGKAEQRYRELIDPLTKKIHDIIKKIAEDEKYTMIFDASMGTILYAMPTTDITELVTLDLNKGTVRPGTQNLNTTDPNQAAPPKPIGGVEVPKTEDIKK